MIVITQEQYESILNHALAELPNEACGLLGGCIENGVKCVKKVYFFQIQKVRNILQWTPGNNLRL